jgi:biuret amidohydrolase
VIKIEPQSAAVIVVDMQNDFCSKDGYYARKGAKVADFAAVIEPVARFVGAARAQGTTIIYTRLVYGPPRGPMEQRHSIRPRRWSAEGARLITNTWGADVVDELRPQPKDIVIDKPGYSAFEATNLESMLRERGIKTLVMMGIVSYACVLATAFSAFDKDFDVVVIKDAIASWGGSLQAETCQIVDLLMGMAVPAAEVTF